MLLIRNSLYTYITIDLTIYHRMHYTILGRIITIISEIILDLEEDEVRFLPNAVVGSYKACIRLKIILYISKTRSLFWRFIIFVKKFKYWYEF